MKTITDNDRSLRDISYISGPSPNQTTQAKFMSSPFSGSEITRQRTTAQSELNYEVIKPTEFYGEEMAEIINYLNPYSKTPPRPIFNKETDLSILKEIAPSSSEYGLIAALLGIQNKEKNL